MSKIKYIGILAVILVLSTLMYDFIHNQHNAIEIVTDLFLLITMLVTFLSICYEYFMYLWNKGDRDERDW